MRIIQITDLHIGGPTEYPFEVDVRTNFLRILDEITQADHDLLVISGDLCYQDGEEAIYQWIKTELDKRQLTYAVIPGNHDDDQMLIDTFELPEDRRENFFFHLTDSAPVAFLNSGKGSVNDSELQSLTAYLHRNASPVCIFMHHPPLPMGVPYMDDNHSMTETEALLEILSKHPYPITIFTGHYHVDKSVRWQNVDVHVTPSCFFQIDWRQQDFAVDHHRCAYRWIDWDGNTLQHGLHYIEGAYPCKAGVLVG
ncbi:MAG: metallophosphoesterase [Bacteroidota bacterium]